MFPISDSIPPKRFPFLNVAIILLTIYGFVLQIISPSQEAFISQYALIPSLINLGNPQTLIPFLTSMFLHGGILHIVSNMWFLWVFGDNVEGHTGFFLYPFLYLASGIVGSITQYSLMPDSSIPMLGASGAVAGILGAYFVLFAHSRIKTLVPFFGFFTFINLPASFMLGYWFVLQLFSGAVSLPFSSESGGIAFFAHVGGFATGVIFAKIFRKFLVEHE